jgi:hypothetical protein
MWNRLVMSMGNDEQAMPVVQEDTLLYQKNGQACRLTVGTSAWYAWLSTATTFAFRSAIGTFTARREQAGHKRGGWYWRAYGSFLRLSERPDRAGGGGAAPGGTRALR